MLSDVTGESCRAYVRIRGNDGGGRRALSLQKTQSRLAGIWFQKINQSKFICFDRTGMLQFIIVDTFTEFDVPAKSTKTLVIICSERNRVSSIGNKI